MLDTSPAAGTDTATLIGGASILVAGLMAYLGRALGAKAKEEHPFAAVPEAAGVALGLTDRATQLGIAKDTERTADACEALLEAVTAFIKEVEDDREERDRRDAQDKLDEVKRERDRLQALVDDARRQAGPYSTKPRGN